MTFIIITHVPHIIEQNNYYAYAPYVHEMNIWTKNVDQLILVAPKSNAKIAPTDTHYDHQNIEFVTLASFDMLSLKAVLSAIIKIPKISWQIYTSMQMADHIHLRCPGNVGFLGAMIQTLFPYKYKTAKYAGNWDPQSKQPWSYRMQKWILNNTFLTRNINVMVYGEWPSQSRNIKPFFTGTYSEKEKLPLQPLKLNAKVNFIFVGSLVKEKNPLYAIQLVEALIEKGYQVELSLFGDGVERESLQGYVNNNNLESSIKLKGNQSQEVIKRAYQESHFVTLPSESEGWPKAIAEGMFWGCVPLVTPVSCVPFMLDYGKRGILLEMNLEKDLIQIRSVLQSQSNFDIASNEASTWSRYYTVDVFEKEIKQFLS
jgi:glycosyltransferase involved in cell wall biosynthesis